VVTGEDDYESLGIGVVAHRNVIAIHIQQFKIRGSITDLVSILDRSILFGRIRYGSDHEQHCEDGAHGSFDIFFHDWFGQVYFNMVLMSLFKRSLSILPS